MELRAEDPSYETQVPDEFIVIEESPGPPPLGLIGCSRPSCDLSVATYFDVQRIEPAVRVRVRCPIDARFFIDLADVAEVDVNIADRQRSDPRIRARCHDRTVGPD
jgi:hypothetical protein